MEEISDTSVNVGSSFSLGRYLFMVRQKVFKFQKDLLDFDDFDIDFEIKLNQNMIDRKIPTFIALYFVIRYFSVVFIKYRCYFYKKGSKMTRKIITVRNRISIYENSFKLIIHPPVFSFNKQLFMFFEFPPML